MDTSKIKILRIYIYIFLLSGLMLSGFHLQAQSGHTQKEYESNQDTYTQCLMDVVLCTACEFDNLIFALMKDHGFTVLPFSYEGTYPSKKNDGIALWYHSIHMHIALEEYNRMDDLETWNKYRWKTDFFSYTVGNKYFVKDTPSLKSGFPIIFLHSTLRGRKMQISSQIKWLKAIPGKPISLEWNNQSTGAKFTYVLRDCKWHLESEIYQWNLKCSTEVMAEIDRLKRNGIEFF